MHPYLGELKQLPQTNNNGKLDDFDVFALAKKSGISVEEMKEMSYVSLVNVLISMVYDEDTTNGVSEATPEDIRRYFG